MAFLSLDQFELMVYDCFEMDISVPKYCPWYEDKWNKEVAKEQAVCEIMNYVTDRFKKQRGADISEYIVALTMFGTKMKIFYRKENREHFMVYRQMALNIQDILVDIMEGAKQYNESKNY